VWQNTFNCSNDYALLKADRTCFLLSLSLSLFLSLFSSLSSSQYAQQEIDLYTLSHIPSCSFVNDCSLVNQVLPWGTSMMTLNLFDLSLLMARFTWISIVSFYKKNHLSDRSALIFVFVAIIIIIIRNQSNLVSIDDNGDESTVLFLFLVRIVTHIYMFLLIRMNSNH
jgi:hypothetical protein